MKLSDGKKGSVLAGTLMALPLLFALGAANAGEQQAAPVAAVPALPQGAAVAVQQQDFKILSLDVTEGARKLRFMLTVDALAEKNIAAATAQIDAAQGSEKLAVLQAKGARLADAVMSGALIPAMQEFNAQSGKRTYLEHRRDGLLQDAADGAPARQWFNTTGSRATMAQSWDSGSFIKTLSAKELQKLSQKPTPASSLKVHGPA